MGGDTRIRKVIFPVARRDTRFLPASKAIPKEMMPVLDRPIIQYAVEEARAAGCEKFIFVGATDQAALEAHFDPSAALEQRLTESRAGEPEEGLAAALKAAEIPSGDAIFIRQHEVRGIGHALLCARDLIGDEPFAVILPDDMILAERPVLAQMVRRYQDCEGALVAGIEVPRERVSRYGIMRIEDDGGDIVRVTELQEKPHGDDVSSNFSITGRYILPPQLFDALAAATPDQDGRIQLTDALTGLVDTVGVQGFRYQGERFDCGTALGFVQATVAYAALRPELAPSLKTYLRRFLERAE
ncbi:MAG: NTP transferase domain-containing protein [Rhodobacteraceae bacterium]|nr:NTP transferase domain-containing protein [Paracoccaceae bacterium]